MTNIQEMLWLAGKVELCTATATNLSKNHWFVIDKSLEYRHRYKLTTFVN
jgi:hypothetical protein